MHAPQLTIFHARELEGHRREVVLRAYSASDSVGIIARALGVSSETAGDRSRFTIVEVNYGDDFLAAGPRGIIAVF